MLYCFAIGAGKFLRGPFNTLKPMDAAPVRFVVTLTLSFLAYEKLNKNIGSEMIQAIQQHSHSVSPEMYTSAVASYSHFMNSNPPLHWSLPPYNPGLFIDSLHAHQSSLPPTYMYRGLFHPDPARLRRGRDSISPRKESPEVGTEILFTSACSFLVRCISA